MKRMLCRHLNRQVVARLFHKITLDDLELVVGLLRMLAEVPDLDGLKYLLGLLDLAPHCLQGLGELRLMQVAQVLLWPVRMTVWGLSGRVHALWCSRRRG